MSWGEVKKINSNLKTPLNEGGVKIVKSVQRGSATGTMTGDTSIAISEVNPSKCIVLLNGGIIDRSGYNTNANIDIVREKELTENTLIISGGGYRGTSGSVNGTITYTVVEFY